MQILNQKQIVQISGGVEFASVKGLLSDFGGWVVSEIRDTSVQQLTLMLAMNQVVRSYGRTDIDQAYRDLAIVPFWFMARLLVS